MYKGVFFFFYFKRSLPVLETYSLMLMNEKMHPLHVGFTIDEGGNTIKLHWYGLQSNLHHVSKYNFFLIGSIVPFLSVHS